MGKYYFDSRDESDDRYCWTKRHFLELMKEEEITELIVEEAKLETGVEYFYCAQYGTVGEKEQGTCGIMCKFYEPRNGKSGRCKSSLGTYLSTGKLITLKTKKS